MLDHNDPSYYERDYRQFQRFEESYTDHGVESLKSIIENPNSKPVMRGNPESKPDPYGKELMYDNLESKPEPLVWLSLDDTEVRIVRLPVDKTEEDDTV